MSADPLNLAKTLGLNFQNPALLRQAFVHRSYLNEHKESGLLHNERLEFLGDAVLELAITELLYRAYPDKTEGDLTSFRAALVNWNVIGEVAEALGLNDHLYLSRGEAKDIGRARQVILANTYEALVGALYLDQGWEVARDFITRTLASRIKPMVESRAWQDAKSFFQEKAQAVYSLTPRYELLSQDGPDHDKTFRLGLYVGERLVAEGLGHSKQEAEQAAARAGLAVEGWG